MNVDPQQLIQLATEVSERAYAKYSNFRVGAAVLTDDGQVYVGCNVENASYGLTICAERSAVFSAVAGGASKIVAVGIYTPTDHLVTPCGACRQVLTEFSANMQVFIGNRAGQMQEYSLAALLPHNFEL